MQKKCYSYPVEFVEDVFGDSSVLAELLQSVTGEEHPRVLIVADMNVVQRTAGLGAKIGRYVQAHGIALAGSPVVLTGGEKIKSDSLQSALQVVSAILSAKLGRKDVVMVIGGGTMLDVAGYAASQVRGGVPIVRIPTTPSAMIDAAFADYAAVDSATVKDALRVASVPAAVVIDRTFATTVLDGVWRGGLGEAVRLAVSSDAALVKKLAKLAGSYCERNPDALAEMLEVSWKVRAKKGAPALVPWAANRLEEISSYKFPHGYAVPICLCLDLGYAAETGSLKPEERDMVVDILRTGGALDGLSHSVHLLGQTANMLNGIDAVELASGIPGIPVLAGLGKTKHEDAPNREVLKNILKELVSSPARG